MAISVDRTAFPRTLSTSPAYPDLTLRIPFRTAGTACGRWLRVCGQGYVWCVVGGRIESMASPIDHVASHLAHPLGGFNRRTPKRTEAEGGTYGNPQEQTGYEYEDAWPRVRDGSPRQDKRVSKAPSDSAHIEALHLHISPAALPV